MFLGEEAKWDFSYQQKECIWLSNVMKLQSFERQRMDNFVFQTSWIAFVMFGFCYLKLNL